MQSGKQPFALSAAKGKHLKPVDSSVRLLRCFAAAQHDTLELVFHGM